MKLLFVCLGNICRSPMAEFICKDIIKKENVNIDVTSCGTGGYHDGEDMHPKTKQLLKNKDIYCEGFISKKITKRLFDENDYVIVMDNNNYNDVVLVFGNNKKIIKITDFSSNKTVNHVPDPWYTGNFVEVYEILNDCINNFLKNKNII